MAWTAGVDKAIGYYVPASVWNLYLGATGSLEYLKDSPAFGAFISVGTTPATTGAIRLNCNGSIQRKNNAGDASYNMIGPVGEANDLVIGDGLAGDMFFYVGSAKSYTFDKCIAIAVQSPGNDTPAHYFTGAVYNANFAMNMAAIYDAGAANQFLTFNARLTGGTAAAPTFGASGNPGFYIGCRENQFAIGTIPTGTAQVPTNRITLDLNGNIGIGLNVLGTNAVRVIGIANGTAPSTSPANMVQLWAEDVVTSELKVRDEAGNVTTLSPHNFSLFTPDANYEYPWSYHARNEFIGREINVDMYGAIAEIERLSNKKFIHTRDLPSKADWDAQQALNKIAVEKEDSPDEIEISIAEALEQVPVEIEQDTGQTRGVIEHKLNPRTGLVEKSIRIEKVMEKIDGAPEYRLKANVRLDQQSGKFFAKVKKVYKMKDIPAWIAALAKK